MKCDALTSTASPGSNHASNYISLKGTFNTDNKRMLKQIEEAEKAGVYKPERYRGF